MFLQRLFPAAVSLRGAALLLCALALIAALGCAPRQQRPLTFEEQQLRMAEAQCRQEASSMNPEWRGNSRYFPWRAYFEMCMHRLGVTDAELKTLWY
ncbi:hypothetical protein [Desulfovibrio legallii]|jgi:hypothetical protein|uniref:Lipoprotein n=1 Tax=Desulfovibrio legallii TaxID=571438 RepID=A0A1G7IPL3_9BACT|nr:hypothetical protein [Desulfovibrio legallii]SDF14486.1 hypothetical protein SAMN05192586_10217 [Desulfovibrio legallii]